MREEPDIWAYGRGNPPDADIDRPDCFCAHCGTAEVFGDEETCPACQTAIIREAAETFFTPKEYLETREKQAIGCESWTDFVLNYCFGIPSCDNEELATELLGFFEPDTEIDMKGGAVEFRDALADYVISGPGDFADWLRAQGGE